VVIGKKDSSRGVFPCCCSIQAGFCGAGGGVTGSDGYGAGHWPGGIVPTVVIFTSFLFPRGPESRVLSKKNFFFSQSIRSKIIPTNFTFYTKVK
jgi:hypothetical protein